MQHYVDNVENHFNADRRKLQFICADLFLHAQVRNNIKALIATKLQQDGRSRSQSKMRKRSMYSISRMNWCQSLTFLKMVEKIVTPYFRANPDEAQRPRAREMVISMV